MLSNPVIDTQLKHVSVRSFKPDPINTEILNSILEAGRRSPTSSNLQSYSVIVVRDTEKKQQISELAGKQQHIQDCPVFLIFCADLHRGREACEMHGTKMTNNLETFLISTIDASLVGMSVQTAAESVGLGAVMVGGIRNNLREVAQLVDLPSGVYPVYGMSLGWPILEQMPPQKPRLPRDVVIHEDQYDLSDISPALKAHDEELAAHYEALGQNLSAHAWSGTAARILSRPLRPDVGKIINELGFQIS